MTQDADLVVEATGSSASRFVSLLGQGFYASEEAAREAVRRRGMFNVIHLETGFKVDLVVRKDRAYSREEFERRLEGVLAGRRVSFASAEDTILSKLEWARDGHSERQYSDAVGVLKVQAARLDWAYLERWSGELGLAGLLRRARGGEPFAP